MQNVLAGMSAWEPVENRLGDRQMGPVSQKKYLSTEITSLQEVPWAGLTCGQSPVPM